MNRQKGAALILVLWIIVALSLLAVSFSATVRVEVDAARNVVQQKQAYYLARAGIEYATYKILQAQGSFAQIQQGSAPADLDQMPEVFTGQTTLDVAEGKAVVDVVDENGKINVNMMPPEILFNLMIMVGIEPGVADVITNSLLDWRDADDLITATGAESEYYLALDDPYYAKNGPLDVTEELLLIQGVTPEIYYGRKGLAETGEPVEYFGLQKYFTTFSTLARINVNSAPAVVLAAIPGLDYDTALQVVSLREQSPVMNMTDITDRVPGLSGEVLNFLTMLRSTVYSVTSTGSLPNSEVVSVIRAVIRVDGAGDKGYSVLYWNESNTEL